MTKLITILVLFLSIICYSQEELDKIELRNETVLLGKVEKIKTDLVEFRDNETGLVYEYDKSEIRYIQLANGKILTFEEDYKGAQEKEQQPPQQTQQPIVIEKDSGSSTGLIILATVGVVLIVLLIIGAASS